jgi:multiple sugar transport system substrate-binding protein
MKARSLSLSIVLLLSLVLAGCSLAAAAELKPQYRDFIEYKAKEISIFNPGTAVWDEATLLNIERYEYVTSPRGTGKGVKVKVIEVPAAELFVESRRSLVQHETTYTVYYPGAFEIMDFARAGFFEPIDSIPEAQQNEWAPSIKKAYTINGKLYAAPQIANSVVLIYRKSMFEDAGLDPEGPPSTWAEFKEAAKKLTKDTDGDGKVDQYGYILAGKREYSGAWETFMHWLYSAGGRLFSDTDGDGKMDKVTLDADSAVRALTLLTEMLEEGYSPPGCPNFTETEAEQAFYTGRAAMILAEGWVGTAAVSQIGPEDVGIAMYPIWEEADPDKAGGFLEVPSLAINAFASEAKKVAAQKYVQFLSTPVSQIIELVDEGNDSAIPSVYEIPYIQRTVPGASIKKQAGQKGVFELYPSSLEVNTIIEEAVNIALTEAKTPEKALRDAANKIRKIKSVKDWLGL